MLFRGNPIVPTDERKDIYLALGRYQPMAIWIRSCAAGAEFVTNTLGREVLQEVTSKPVGRGEAQPHPRPDTTDQ